MDVEDIQELKLGQQKQLCWLQTAFLKSLHQDNDQKRFVSMFNRVIELIPGYIAWKGSDGRFLGCNKELANYLGLLSPGDIVGLGDADVRWYEPVETLVAIDKKVLESQLSVTREVEVVTPKGERLCFLSQYAPLWIEEHQVKAMIFISFDITPQKNMLRALERENNRAEAANLAKDQFITQMCHDIRTPFCGLVSMVEQLAVTEVNPRRRSDLELIGSSAERLLQMLNQIIDSAKMTESHMEMMPCSFVLKDMVCQITQLLLPAAQEKSLQLDVQLAESLHGNIVAPEQALGRVVLNLLSNAVKYTERGSIQLQFELLEEEGGMFLEGVIRDTGVGIPSDQMDYIFGRFNQINASSNQGVGMGLHMVKVLLQKMHGSIHVQSELGKGSVFRFLVPLVNRPAALKVLDKDDSAVAIPKIIQYHHILLVEDSMIAQRAAELIFDRLGGHLTITETANSALQLDLSQFDLIFIDVGLPDVSGDRFAYMLREQFKVDAKIVILTAQHDFAERCRYVSVIDEFIQKPLTYRVAERILSEPLVTAVS